MFNRELSIKQITSSPPFQKYSLTVVTYFVILFLGLFAVRPTLITITRVRKEVRKKEEINKQLDKKIANFTALKQDYINIKGQLDDLELIFPSSGDFSLFLANVEDVCRRNDFEMQSVSFNDSRDKPDIEKNRKFKVLSTRKVNVVVVGDDTNLLSLLQDFEMLPMFPEITGVTFSEKLNKEGKQTFSIEMRLFKINKLKFYEK